MGLKVFCPAHASICAVHGQMLRGQQPLGPRHLHDGIEDVLSQIPEPRRFRMNRITGSDSGSGPVQIRGDVRLAAVRGSLQDR